MRLAIKLLFLQLLFSTLLLSQNFSGNWSGVVMKAGSELEQADVLYITFEGEGEALTGLSRIELLNDTEFAVKAFKGKEKGSSITLSEELVRRSSSTPKSPECKLNYELTYDDSNGYLKGTYKSSDCRNMMGEIILFRSEHTVTTDKEPFATHSWKHKFVMNYKKGYPAPERMLAEQQNFKFQPIYFDHDEHEIKPEFHEYLNRMARVLDGIHDLRVKITGHTDAVGTDEYNIGLSERRAKSIRAYFKSRGIDPEKLEIDFKGKREPIDTNATREGKQRNRRVNFEFIYS